MGHNPWGNPEKSPTVYGLPLWAQNPDVALAYRPQIDNSTLFDMAVLNRYPDQNQKNAMNSYRDELGVPPAKISSVSMSPGPNGLPPHGSWAPDENTIRINAADSPAVQMETLGHEYAHKADEYQSPNFNYEDPNKNHFDALQMQSPTHHHYFTNFAPQMAQSLDAQRAKEYDWPVNPEIEKKMPWLNQVRPLSSNPLANPWMLEK